MANLHVPFFTLNGKPLDLMTQQMYLGVVVEDKFHDDTDMYRQMKSIYRGGNILIKKYSLCSTEVKIKVFKLTSML